MSNFSPEQQTAIEHKDGNMVVISAAGSGKTTVIVNRVVALIDSGVNPKNILCITFSKKAKENKTGIFAPENIGMCGRIGGKIGGPKGMAIVNAMKYQCNDCGYTSRPRWVIHHINKTGHTGYTKL